MPVHLHVAQSFEEAESVRARGQVSVGKRIIELLSERRVLLAHGLYLTEKDSAEMIRQNWVLAYCPYSQLQFGFLGPLGEWVSMGGSWALGTDCVASNDSLDVQRELPLAGGHAALVASFSDERQRVLRSGGAVTEKELEARRKKELSRHSLPHAQGLLHAACGGALEDLSAAQFGPNTLGLRSGARASFLVLKQEHPVLNPRGDLVRAHAYSPTVNAIDFAVVSGVLSDGARG